MISALAFNDSTAAVSKDVRAFGDTLAATLPNIEEFGSLDEDNQFHYKVSVIDLDDLDSTAKCNFL